MIRENKSFKNIIGKNLYKNVSNFHSKFRDERIREKSSH